MSLREDIESAINRNCAENGSDTPDFILASYLLHCLDAFDVAVNAREKWYGREPGMIRNIVDAPSQPAGDLSGDRESRPPAEHGAEPDESPAGSGGVGKG